MGCAKVGRSGSMQQNAGACRIDCEGACRKMQGCAGECGCMQMLAGASVQKHREGPCTTLHKQHRAAVCRTEGAAARSKMQPRAGWSVQQQASRSTRGHRDPQTPTPNVCPHAPPCPISLQHPGNPSGMEQWAHDGAECTAAPKGPPHCPQSPLTTAQSDLNRESERLPGPYQGVFTAAVFPIRHQVTAAAGDPDVGVKVTGGGWPRGGRFPWGQRDRTAAGSAQPPTWGHPYWHGGFVHAPVGWELPKAIPVR